jgi:prefoldin subunit 5
MGMTHKEQELTQAKDMLQIKLERLEKEIEELKADKRNLQQQVSLLKFVRGELSG